MAGHIPLNGGADVRLLQRHVDINTVRVAIRVHLPSSKVALQFVA